MSTKKRTREEELLQQLAEEQHKLVEEQRKLVEEQRKRQRAEDRADDLEKQMRSVVDHGLPALPAYSSGSKASGAENKRHSPATIVRRKGGFKAVKGLRAKLVREGTYRIWGEAKKGGNILPEYHSETDVAFYVMLVLRDVAAALAGVVTWDEITFASELSVFGDRADIWVMRRRGIPVGVVEVKKPGSHIMSDPLVAGQIFDYMTRLRSFYGLDSVFGLVTTYREWRVFWLEDSDAAAASETVAAPSAAALANPLERLLPAVPTWSAKAAPAKKSTSPPRPPPPRRLAADEPFAFNHKDVIVLIASALLKMAASAATKLPRLVSPDRLCITATKQTWLWERLAPEFELCTWPMPRANAETFHLLLHMGDGEYGRVWLAATGAGAGCVIKFPRADAPTDFEHEKTVWNEVWPAAKARIVTLAEKRALVMPYVKTWTAAAGKGAAIKAAVKAAVQHMAGSGWQHHDVEWRHVGLYKDEGGATKTLLIDLGSAKRIAAGKARQAEREMLAKLGL